MGLNDRMLTKQNTTVRHFLSTDRGHVVQAKDFTIPRTCKACRLKQFNWFPILIDFICKKFLRVIVSCHVCVWSPTHVCMIYIYAGCFALNIGHMWVWHTVSCFCCERLRYMRMERSSEGRTTILSTYTQNSQVILPVKWSSWVPLTLYMQNIYTLNIFLSYI